MDNFPALVIYLSLLALSYDPGLWRRFYTQENLLLSKADYAAPDNSECFKSMRGSPDTTVRYLAGYLEECCAMPVDQVPELESILHGVPVAPASAASPAPPLSSPPPASATPSPPVAGGGSEYRNLLQMGQVNTPTVAASPPNPAPLPTTAPPSQPTVASAGILCPQCNLSNPVNLVYCDDEGCASVLYPGNRFCAYCGESIPVNGDYCPECGSRLV